MHGSSSIVFVAGEASGDLLAAQLVRELRQREPGVELLWSRRRSNDCRRL
jgi:lipid A disaccharide synthetase